MAQSIIFVTTETSGSQSLCRIQTALAKGVLKHSVPKPAPGKRADLSCLEREGFLYIIRGVTEFDGPIYSPEFRYVVNVRDPRDMVCNQYYWLTQHPINGAASPEIEASERIKRQQLFDAGIDHYATRSSRSRAFDYVFSIADTPTADALFVSYNQLCCGYDAMVDRLVDFVGLGRSKHADSVIHAESPDGLSSNDKWIGNKWVGCDSQPGRYRKELKPETILILNRHYAGILARLRDLELPEFKSFYDADSRSAALNG